MEAFARHGPTSRRGRYGIVGVVPSRRPPCSSDGARYLPAPGRRLALRTMQDRGVERADEGAFHAPFPAAGSCGSAAPRLSSCKFKETEDVPSSRTRYGYQ